MQEKHFLVGMFIVDAIFIIMYRIILKLWRYLYEIIMIIINQSKFNEGTTQFQN